MPAISDDLTADAAGLRIDGAAGGTDYGRTKKFSWEPSYVDRDAMFPPSASAGVHFKDWDRWEDPFHMNYRRYVEIQNKKEVSFHPARTAFDRYKIVGNLDQRWMEGVKLTFPFLMAAEYAANRVHARTARYAPAAALRTAAFYQSIDELRHSQNHLYEMRRIQRASGAFNNWARWRDHHFEIRGGLATYQDILGCDNIFESIIALNLCAEVGLTNLIFVGIPQVAAINGDVELAQEFLTTQSDETRHMALAQSTVHTLLQGDDRNLVPLQYWFDKWFWLQHRAIAAPVGTVIDYFARHKAQSYKEMYQRYVVHNFIGGLVDDLGEFGFGRPRFLDVAVAELDDYSHSLWRGLYMYKHLLLHKVFPPTERDVEFFEAKYPHWRERHGRFWDEVAAGDPKDVAQLPMLCQVCQLPCVFPTPEHPSVQVSEWAGRVYTTCSVPCKWIFDHEPVRYSYHEPLDKLLNGRDVPEIRAYMGLSGADGTIHGGLLAEEET